MNIVNHIFSITMDIKLKEYLNDGSDWQSQAVLAYLREFEYYKLGSVYNYDYGVYLPDFYLKVGRIDNCREQGHIYQLYTKDYHLVCSFWVCRYRNTDDLCVRFFNQEGCGGYTPSIMAGVSPKDEWYIDQSFDYGDIKGCGDFIFSVLKKKIEEYEHIK